MGPSGNKEVQNGLCQVLICNGRIDLDFVRSFYAGILILLETKLSEMCFLEGNNFSCESNPPGDLTMIHRKNTVLYDCLFHHFFSSIIDF